MRTLARVLAWDAVLVHGSSLLIFVGLHILVFIHARDQFWWVFAFLFPIFVVSVIGWAIQAQILFKGTSELRGNKDS